MSCAGRREKYLGLFVAAIALLVYVNSLANTFVSDDHSVILRNPLLQGDPFALFGVIDTTSDTKLLPFYRPLTYLTFLVEGRIHGFNPFLMHLFNVLLHASIAFLFYRLAQALFNNKNVALLSGLIFAVHPINSEAVNFLSGGRNTLLASFFILGAYLLHRQSIIRENLPRALAGAAFFFAGLLSKETALAVLPFIIVQEVISLRNHVSGSRLRSFLRLLPYAIATICYLVMRWMTLSRLGIQTSPIPGFGMQMLQSIYIIPSLTERLLNNMYIIPKYILTIIFPLYLSPRYDIPQDFHLLALPLSAAWFCIIAAAVWLLTRGRSRVTLFGLSWFVAFWLPVSGIFFFGTTPLADRFLYIPAIGLWLIAADQGIRLLSSGFAARKYAIIAAALIFVALSVLTVSRNMDWRSDVTLFTRLAQQYPENAYGHVLLGNAYIERGGVNDLKLAEVELRRALALEPSIQSAHTPLGYIQLTLGDFEGAVYHYSEALAIFPLDRDARINRGIAYEKLGRYAEALSDYQFYLTIPGRNTVPGSIEHAEKKVRELANY